MPSAGECQQAKQAVPQRKRRATMPIRLPAVDFVYYHSALLWVFERRVRYLGVLSPCGSCNPALDHSILPDPFVCEEAVLKD